MLEHREEFLNASDIKHLRIIEDQRVDRGGVLVETDGGTIDARIGTQLNEAKRVLHVEDELIVQPADAPNRTARSPRELIRRDDRSCRPLAPFAADRYLEDVHAADLLRTNGKVRQVIGTVIESNGPPMSIGETALIMYKRSVDPVLAEAVGFRDSKVLLMPLGDIGGIAAGAEVVALGRPLTIGLTEGLLGRVLDGLGRPIDGLGPIVGAVPAEISGTPPSALLRKRIEEPLGMGVKSIDGLLTCGKGQRVGIFSGSGVGKSTILGMIARNTSADVNVIGLVGERGKEVRDSSSATSARKACAARWSSSRPAISRRSCASRRPTSRPASPSSSAIAGSTSCS